VLTLVAALAIFSYGLMSALLGALLPTYGLSYGLSSAEQGSLGLTNALGLVVASLSTGPLVDWKGKKLGLLAGLSLLAAALLAAPRATGYAVLLVVYFTLGVGGGTISTSANALVGDMSAERRGPALNFVNLFFGLGGVMTTYSASYLFSSATLCYFIAVIVVVALLITATVPVAKPKPSGVLLFRLDQVPRLLSNPTLIALSLLMFLYVACEVGVWNWLKVYLISIQFTAQRAGGIVSYGFALGILLGRVVVSRLLVTIPAIVVIIASSCLIALSTFSMLSVSSQISVTIAVFCAGIAMASVFPTTLSIVGGQFPQVTATAMGIAITSGWLGLAVSSPIIGSFAGKSSLHNALLLLPALAIAMVLVSLVLYSQLRKAHPA
jgi:fucose permease